MIETEKKASYRASQVVLAIDDAQIRALLGNQNGKNRTGREPVQWNRTTTFYYAAARTPIDGPLLALNGAGPGAGPVNNAVVLSQASERYAPPGAHLIAASWSVARHRPAPRSSNWSAMSARSWGTGSGRMSPIGAWWAATRSCMPCRYAPMRNGSKAMCG